MKRISGFILAAAFALPVHAQTKWDMPTPYPATNFHTENVVQFAADIDKATGGKVKITVHAGASLFKAPEIKRAVQGGQAQAGEILISGYANEDPVFGIDSVPFLATSYPDAKRLWTASRKAIEERFAKQGMVVLYAVPWPPQGIYSTKPLASIADMKGLKMRAYNPATSRIAELAGAQAVTIQAAELAQAMATGAVNANITSGATGYDTKAWEVVKNYYDTQAWLPKNVVFVNKKAFDALDKASQDAVLKAAADAEARGWKVSEEKTAWYLAELRKNGMNVVPPSAQLKADFQKVGATMTEEWLKSAGADGKAIVDAFNKK
ncbi:TRAP transporter substrate-binding protein [Usitatibacter palustris]|uniref:Solute-binding protein n=1 Tax=Usitatibacter palustris TaxID=2732487 RepID=A0A6M4H1M4_9PROT|nr:TRAP transporter substrate-binding protein [Usitatibacter palustris]QJR13401.1 Solute-binding protein [Usitatibacter palustris]